MASVGSKGDSYDNAVAEAFNSLYKSELVRNKGPWIGVTDVEIETAEYLDWFNHRRLHGEIGHTPPTELENNHYAEKRLANPSSPRPGLSTEPGAMHFESIWESCTFLARIHRPA